MTRLRVKDLPPGLLQRMLKQQERRVPKIFSEACRQVASDLTGVPATGSFAPPSSDAEITPAVDSSLPEDIEFTVFGTPQPKQRARKRGSGQLVTPAETVNAERLVALAYCNATGQRIRLTPDGRPFLPGPSTRPMRIDAVFYRPNFRRVDGSNLLKLVEDALNGVAYADDSQLIGGRYEIDFDVRKPRAVITIRTPLLCELTPGQRRAYDARHVARGGGHRIKSRREATR